MVFLEIKILLIQDKLKLQKFEDKNSMNDKNVSKSYKVS